MTIDEAASIAAAAHRGQFRRDGVTPYIEHPAAVAARVRGDEKAEMVAWLHDSIEDTEETAESLAAKGAPAEVVEAVALLAHPRGEPYRQYLERVKAHPLAAKVKVADMLANLSDAPAERQIRKYAQGLLLLLD